MNGDAEAAAARWRALAVGVLAPGFNGTGVPDWLRTAIDDGLGGVVLFGHNIVGPARVAELTASLRGRRSDLLIASDEEGGEVTRIESARGSCLPGAAALGAVDDVELTEALALAHGKLLRALGIDCGLAPVADVNSNPANPVIGVRSFGADPRAVAAHVESYVRGLQQAGELGCVKHFPGHGDTGTDSHLAVPVLRGSLADLHARELIPFAGAVRGGAAAVMPGHLVVPQIDDRPASISPTWMRILRRELGFDGLVITDALDMKAVADPRGVPRAAVQALRAGADLLCLGNTRAIDDERVFLACVQAICVAIADGQLDVDLLVASVRRRRRALAGRVPPSGSEATAFADLRRLGRTVAERAVTDVPPLTGSPAVVDLRGADSAAAGPTSRHLLDALRRRWPRLRVMSVDEPGEQVEAAITSAGPLLVVIRTAPAGSPVAKLVHRIRARRPDAVVVHTGWPGGDEPAGTVFSYGQSAVIAEVLCERLAGGQPGDPSRCVAGAR